MYVQGRGLKPIYGSWASCQKKENCLKIEKKEREKNKWSNETEYEERENRVKLSVFNKSKILVKHQHVLGKLQVL